MSDDIPIVSECLIALGELRDRDIHRRHGCQLLQIVYIDGARRILNWEVLGLGELGNACLQRAFHGIPCEVVGSAKSSVGQ